MERRSFFATLAGLFVLPKFLQAKPNPEPENYALKYARDFYLESERRLNENHCIIEIMDGHIEMSTKSGNARVYDVLSFMKLGSPMFVADVYHIWENSVKTEDRKVVLKPLSQPKKIAGIPVLLVDGKYRQFRAGKNRKFRDRFIVSMTTFRESSNII